MSKLPYKGELDKLQSSKAHYFDRDKLNSLKNSAISKVHKYHLKRNEFYKERKKGVSEDLEPNEFWKMLVSSDVFKSYQGLLEHPEEKPGKFKEWLTYVSSIDEGKIPDVSKKEVDSLDDLLNTYSEKGIHITHSSATTGLFGLAFRDKKTIENMNRGLKVTLEEMTPLSKDHHLITGIPEHTYLDMGWWANNFLNSYFENPEERVHHGLEGELTPDTVRIRAGHTKDFKEKIKGKVISLLGPLMKKKICKRMANKVKELEGEDLFLFGPPSLLGKTSKKVREPGLFHKMFGGPKEYEPKLGENSFVVSSGGFPKYTRERFMREVSEGLEVDKKAIRDGYGCTEAGSFYVECEGHKKHIPPWVRPFVLDKEGKPKERKGKQTGIFGFIDLAVSSYPPAIKMRDKVTINWEGCPECERTGPILEPIIKRTGTGRTGCAAEIEENL